MTARPDSLMTRLFTLLRRLFGLDAPRPQTTDEQMAELKRELDRLLDDDIGGGNG